NEIVIAGNRTSTGNPILMGGPVLGFSLPAIWFQVQLVAPGIDAYGVVLPGDPAIVIGFNNNIAWTLTDTQSISDGTFFFVQQVSNGQYYWNSTEHPVITHSINGVDVNYTNLGSIMVQNGSLALVMDWMGN
ncbi:Peptidase S45, penicillin amidase, partial [mine drainage metagenome]